MFFLTKPACSLSFRHCLASPFASCWSALISASAASTASSRPELALSSSTGLPPGPVRLGTGGGVAGFPLEVTEGIFAPAASSADVGHLTYSGPWGMPAGLTRMRELTRSGYRTAYALARYPPSECPIRTIRSMPSDARQLSSDDRKKCSARATRLGIGAEAGEERSEGDGRDERPMPSQSKKKVLRPVALADSATDSQFRKKKLKVRVSSALRQ